MLCAKFGWNWISNSAEKDFKFRQCILRPRNINWQDWKKTSFVVFVCYSQKLTIFLKSHPLISLKTSLPSLRNFSEFAYYKCLAIWMLLKWSLNKTLWKKCEFHILNIKVTISKLWQFQEMAMIYTMIVAVLGKLLYCVNFRRWLWFIHWW